MKQNKELKDMRKQWLGEMEQKLRETYPKEEDRIFRNPQSPLPKGASPHPVDPHPQARGKTENRRNHKPSHVLVSRDDAMGFYA